MTNKFLRLRLSIERSGFSLKLDEQLSLHGTTAVFGPSGSGKTSLLRAIAGLERHPGGRIEFDKERWQDDDAWVPAHKRRIGVVFQDTRLFPHLNVLGNLHFARQFSHSKQIDRFDEIVQTLRLEKLLTRRVGALSGGEAQRVAIGRCLLTRPQLLLMDEPVSSLDQESKREIIEFIAATTKRFSVPLFYVTHDADEVARLANTTLLLDAGRAIAYGSTSTVFANNDISTLFGTQDASSILVAKIDALDSGSATASIGSQQLTITIDDTVHQSEIQLRVLAKDVVIATQPIEHISIRNTLTGIINTIRPLDAGNAELILGIEQQQLRAHVTNAAIAELDLHPGATVYALIKSVALNRKF